MPQRQVFSYHFVMRREWNEAGRIWSEDKALLDDEQLARCSRAHESGLPISPVPSRMVSNGEYMPAPQTESQKKVEARIQELSEKASRRLGMDRRRFLRTTGGMAEPSLQRYGWVAL